MTFAWRRTFEGSHHDFVACVGDLTVGRIWRQHLAGLGRDTWAWSAAGLVPTMGEIGRTQGEVETRAEAIEALTDAYHRAREWSARTGRPALRPKPPERRSVSIS